MICKIPNEPADRDAEAPLMKTHETHNIALGGFSSVSSGCGEIHAGTSESGFSGSSRSATNCSRTAMVAEDFPHGNGSWTSDISSSHGGMWECKLRDD